MAQCWECCRCYSLGNSGYGHNARPLEDGRCCDDCNYQVIAYRISIYAAPGRYPPLHSEDEGATRARSLIIDSTAHAVRISRSRDYDSRFRRQRSWPVFGVLYALMVEIRRENGLSKVSVGKCRVREGSCVDQILSLRILDMLLRRIVLLTIKSGKVIQGSD